MNSIYIFTLKVYNNAIWENISSWEVIIMMIRINSMRFQNIVNSYIEILNDLEEDCCLYDTLKEDDKFYKQVSNSFRNNMK